MCELFTKKFLNGILSPASVNSQIQHVNINDSKGFVVAKHPGT